MINASEKVYGGPWWTLRDRRFQTVMDVVAELSGQL
jgi:hypothetical protein